MANDVETLSVRLTADIKQYQQQLLRATADTNARTRAIERRYAEMNKKLNNQFASLGRNITGSLAGAFVGAGSLKGFQDLVDAATRTKNALAVAGLSGGELTDVYDKLFASAQRNATPLESMVTLFGRAAQVQKELGVSTNDLVSFTDNVGKALRVAGTDAQTASGALLQLSQALASGTVHAEEFNSINEGALPILQAAAAGITAAGGSVAKLKQMVVDGKLSSQEFFRGIQAGAWILNERLAGAATTVDQAITRLRNSLQDAAGKINDVTGASQLAIEYISRLGGYVEALSNALKAASTGSIGEYTRKLQALANAVKNIPGLEQGVRPFINPLGMLPSSEDIDKFANSITVTPVEKLVKARDDLAAELEKALEIRGSDVTEDQKAIIDKLIASLKDGSATAQSAQAALKSLGETYRRMAGQMQPLIDKLGEATTKAKAFNDEQAKSGFQLSIPDPTGKFYEDSKKRQAFFDQHNAEIARTEMEKEIDTRSKAIIAAAAKVGTTLTEAAAKIQAKSDMLKEASIKSVDTAISGFADRVISAESGGRTDAKNPNSSATGVGQFIESTWLSLFRKYYPEQAATMSRDAILDLRKDAGVSRQLIEAYARENAAILQKAGVSVDEAALQLAHFLGPQGAVNVLKAAPGTLVSQVLNASQINANKSILGNGATVDDVIAYAQRRAGMTTAGTQRLDSRDDFAAHMKEQQQQLAALKEEAGLRASLNPLVNDYGQKLSELQKAQELLTMAQQDGTAAGKELSSAQQLLTGDLSKLSPEAQKQALAMREIATNTGLVTAANGRLEESNEKLKQSFADINSTARDVVGGALSDIRTAMEDGKITAKEWGDILVGVLNKIADKLQDMLLNQLFPTNGPGLLGSLFGGVTSFNPVGKVGLFDKGGYTGAGGKYQPAGVVHKGEFVFNQEAVRRIGVKNLEMLQHGYADGGLVGGVASRVDHMQRLTQSIPPIIRTPPSRVEARSHVVVSVDGDGKVAAYVKEQGRLTEMSALHKGQAALDKYRRFGFHNDWEAHAKSRHVTGRHSGK